MPGRRGRRLQQPPVLCRAQVGKKTGGARAGQAGPDGGACRGGGRFLHSCFRSSLFHVTRCWLPCSLIQEQAHQIEQVAWPCNLPRRTAPQPFHLPGARCSPCSWQTFDLRPLLFLLPLHPQTTGCSTPGCWLRGGMAFPPTRSCPGCGASWARQSSCCASGVTARWAAACPACCASGS